MSSASKTEKPTPKKRRDAAKKGQTFKAKDLSTSCLMLCGLIYLAGNGLLLQVMEVYRRLLAAGFAADPQHYAAALGVLMLKIILPLIAVCFLASAVPTLLTTGMAIASEALKINFGALNPINGFKKLFSLRTLKDTVKSLLYLGCFVIAFWVVWRTQRHLLFAQLYAKPIDLFPIWAHLLLVLLLTFLGCILLILILDALCEYWLYIKDLKMDKQAVKREHKEQDGNPDIKGRRRDLHMELLSEQVKSEHPRFTGDRRQPDPHCRRYLLPARSDDHAVYLAAGNQPARPGSAKVRRRSRRAGDHRCGPGAAHLQDPPALHLYPTARDRERTAPAGLARAGRTGVRPLTVVLADAPEALMQM